MIQILYRFISNFCLTLLSPVKLCNRESKILCSTGLKLHLYLPISYTVHVTSGHLMVFTQHLVIKEKASLPLIYSSETRALLSFTFGSRES